ncbi:MAG: type II toxin-antitoxin system VapC family toxin [Chitinophagales bacterium]
MVGVALDTNIAIDILNERTEIIPKLRSVSFAYLPITVCGELLFGAKNSGRSTTNEIKYVRFINTCIVLNVDFLVANQYAAIRKQLKSIGRPIPENDIWIAAICMVNNLALATHDKHFQYVDGLQLFDWF